MPRSRRRSLLLASSMAAGFAIGGPLSLLATDVNVTLKIDPDGLSGTDPQGRVLLYTPELPQPGLSVVHFDASAFPDLLMEPAGSSAASFQQIDLTESLLHDVGWPGGNARVGLRIVDPPGQGFNDPVLGPRRILALRRAASVWANRLGSSVQINLEARFADLGCDPGGAVLARAAPGFLFADFPNAPFPGTWYHGALAEALARRDLSLEDGAGPEASDLILELNSRIDEECLGAGSGFYYRLDGNVPDGQISFVNVGLHQIAHGLGFGTFADPRTGAFFMGRPDVYSHFVFDNVAGTTWDRMTTQQRRLSAVRTGQVAWDGPGVTSLAGNYLDPAPSLTVNAPASIAGSYRVGVATFGPPLTAEGLTGDLALALDATARPSLLCAPVTNTAQVTGKVAVVDRGECDFVDKVRNAQEAGAIALIVVNDEAGAPPGLSGSDPAILIPTVSVGQTDGELLKIALQDGETACRPDATRMCLSQGRFQVDLAWRDFQDVEGSGRVVLTSEDSGLFWFFDPDNWEVLVKVLDGCAVNDRFWVFAAATTNIEYTLTVLDTATGMARTFVNPLGESAEAITDTGAFATCP